MLTYVNYLSLVQRARSLIVENFVEDIEKENAYFWSGDFLGLLLFIYPISISSFLFYGKNKLNNPDFRLKFDNFYKDINVISRGRRTVFFYPLFLIQRWFMIFISPIFGNDSGLQFVALINTVKLVIIFYGWINPHLTRQRKYIEYFNNSTIMLMTYCMISMTSFVSNAEVIFNTGYIFLSLFVLLALINLVYISYILKERYIAQKRMKFF